MNRKIGIIGTLLAVMTLMVVFAVVPAWAADPVNASATVNSNTSYAPSGSAGSSAATGGNITQIDLSVSTSTSKWQGYYGNVSGGITLADSDNSNKMYEWTNTIVGNVFAAQDPNMNNSNWIGLTNRSGSEIDTNFSYTPGDSDSATNTFINDSTSITVAGTTYNLKANSSVKTYSGGVPTWETIALANSTSPADGNYVFAGIISNDGTAYNGENADFQIIVPIGSSPTYYFYVELNP